MSIKLTLPWPPSVNTYWRSFGGRNILSKSGRNYKVNAGTSIMLAGHPKFVGPCRVSILLYPPDLRKRDADNTLKPILDVLVEGKVIGGDDYTIVRGISVDWRDKDGNPRAEITVTMA